ncbi:isochorismatase family protein [Polymorphobacter sp.]|uniref:isochorismatase family protein n=1 Tax=Polymorphobacter sp. TaxID=1909290 RepID=UPI003F6F55B9
MLNDDYIGAGFGGRLKPGARPALILIDFAAAYYVKDSPLYAGVEEARASAARLRDAARAAGIPVIFTRVEYSEDGHEGGMFFRKIAALKCFVTGNPLAEFTPELAPLPGDRVLTKHYPSAFMGTALASQLMAEGIDTLVVTGLSTSGCVRATSVDALCLGFVPVVVSDAVGDRDPNVHAANMFDLTAKTAEVLNEAQTLEYFQGLAAEKA